MAGDAALDADADGGDFGPVYPDAGATSDALGGEIKGGEGVDDGLLEEADVVDGASGAGVEIEDGVGDELAGAVEGDVAASVDRDYLGAASGEIGQGGDDVGTIGGGAEGEDGAVLDQRERLEWLGSLGSAARSAKAIGGFELP